MPAAPAPLQTSRVDLMSRLQEGSVTVLDVRPQDEFAVGHLPGALNIPLAELERRLGELPAEHEVIAYCRDRLAGYKKPRHVVFVEELPRNPTGKILKYVLRDQYRHLGIEEGSNELSTGREAAEI